MSSSSAPRCHAEVENRGNLYDVEASEPQGQGRLIHEEVQAMEQVDPSHQCQAPGDSPMELREAVFMVEAPQQVAQGTIDSVSASTCNCRKACKYFLTCGCNKDVCDKCHSMAHKLHPVPVRRKHKSHPLPALDSQGMGQLDTEMAASVPRGWQKTLTKWWDMGLLHDLLRCSLARDCVDLLNHSAEKCFYIIAKSTLCFKSKDFVGHVSTMASSSVVTARKLCDKYRHYMHLRLNRLDE